jgi:hypothetical protein
MNDAIRLYSASQNLDSTNAAVLIALGDLLQKAGSIEEARRYWTQAAHLGGVSVDDINRRLASLPQQSDHGSGTKDDTHTGVETSQIQSKQSPVPAAPPLTPDANQLSRSKVCSVTLQPLVTGNYQPPPSTLTMNNDGGWCWFYNWATFHSIRVIPIMNVTKPPMHG